MKKPCNNCPFREDVQFALPIATAKRISQGVINGDKSFPCHKTVDYSNNSDGKVTQDSKPCVGAILSVEKTRGDFRANLAMRLDFACGDIVREEIDFSVPVHDAKEFVEKVGTY